VRAELSAVGPGSGAGAGGAPVEYAVAVDHYLAQASLSPASRRVYRISLISWAWPLVGKAAPLGSQRRGARPPVVPLAMLEAGDAPAKLAAAVARRARHADARTVNREVSALRSAAGWWLDLHWIDRDPTTGLRHLIGGPAALPALSDRQVAEVFRLPAGLREQALWRVLHDSGSPADQVLALDAGSVDLAGRRVRPTVGRLTGTAAAGAAPAAAADLIQLRPETSEILSWLLAGRPCGPLFLTDRRAPARAPASDVCPVTGRARMSYRRAAEIFTDRTRPLDPAGRGWTLHQLRPASGSAGSAGREPVRRS
jgi:hypothetical protein